MKAIDYFTKQLVGTQDIDFIIDTGSCYASAHFEHGGHVRSGFFFIFHQHHCLALIDRLNGQYIKIS